MVPTLPQLISSAALHTHTQHAPIPHAEKHPRATLPCRRRLVEWDDFSEKMGSEGYPSSPRSAWEQSSRAFERLSTLLREMQVRFDRRMARMCTREWIDGAYSRYRAGKSPSLEPAEKKFVLVASGTNAHP